MFLGVILNIQGIENVKILRTENILFCFEDILNRKGPVKRDIYVNKKVLEISPEEILKILKN